ncbi:MAG: helix-hairpin-helix domain-containing protein [Bacteroidales bacterium]|nr:helix-hairpin-helix domain-containing protein [Bacteroidales bacterium]
METVLIMLSLLVPGAESILVITGASTMEDLDESTVERFETMRNHPIAINCCTKSRLLSCGLFSRYQAASLLDYRSRCGDILSVTELSAVDGFGPVYAEALSGYVSFEGGNTGTSSRVLSQSLTARSWVRTPGDGTQFCAGLKYHGEYGDLFEFNWQDRTTYDNPKPGWGCMNAAYYGRTIALELVAGDFNARFGQGLLMWSGTSMSGVSSPRSLVRSGTGISPSRSFNEGLHGFAAEYSVSGWTFSAACDRQGLGIAAVNYTGKTLTAGVTGYVSRQRSAISADWRIGFRNGAFYGEAAWEGGLPACVAGVLIVPAYGTALSAALRAYPTGYSGTYSGAVRSGSSVSDELGASAAAQNGWGLVTMDAAWHPSKQSFSSRIIAQAERGIPAGPFDVKAQVRLSERCSISHPGDNPGWKHDLRTQLEVSAGEWGLNARAELVRCEDWAWLWYGELAWAHPYGGSNSVSAWLRVENYCIDNWSDRIYVYERDAPGNYNVPAYYGRGWNFSLVASWKSGRHALYFRASSVKREVRLQYTVKFAHRLRRSA